MFNFFKKKVELKNTKVLMNSVYEKRGIKLDSEIAVPTNFECLIYYKSKYYSTLTSGKYQVNSSLVPTLFEKQAKQTKKRKRIKLVLHYINLSNQSIKFTYKKQKYVANIKVTNTQTFVEWMLLYNFKVDSSYAISNITDLLREILSRYNDIKVINKISTKFGITINSIEFETNKSSIFNESTSNANSNKSKQSIFNTNAINEWNNNIDSSTSSTQFATTIQPNNAVTNNTTNQIETDNTTSTVAPNYQSNKVETKTNTCPNCKGILKFTTPYCIHCGFKLDE